MFVFCGRRGELRNKPATAGLACSSGERNTRNQRCPRIVLRALTIVFPVAGCLLWEFCLVDLGIPLPKDEPKTSKKSTLSMSLACFSIWFKVLQVRFSIEENSVALKKIRFRFKRFGPVGSPSSSSLPVLSLPVVHCSWPLAVSRVCYCFSFFANRPASFPSWVNHRNRRDNR